MNLPAQLKELHPRVSAMAARAISSLTGLGDSLVDPGPEFRAAQRNMLWIGAAAGVVAIAHPVSGDEGLAEMPFFGMHIPLGPLALGITLTAFYFWWAFQHEARRVIARHSIAAERGDQQAAAEIEATIAGYVAETVDALKRWRETLESTADQIGTVAMCVDAIRELDTRAREFRDDIVTYTGRGEIERLNAAVSKWNKELYTQISEGGLRKLTVNRLPQSYEVADGMAAELAKLQAGFNRQIRDFRRLSLATKGREKRKFLLHDLWGTRIWVAAMLSLCLLTRVLGFDLPFITPRSPEHAPAATR